MKHETLYKRTKTGAIQYWKIETRTSDLLEGTQIRKESGQLGTTSPIVHLETLHEGKNIGRSNETSHLEQARLEALSDWTKKHDEGYKTLKDLKINAVKDPGWQGIRYETPQGWMGSLEDALQINLPKFNSDANGNVKPMLATDWKKIKKVEYPCYIQPKLDGVRCLMIVNPYQPHVRFLSRSGKEYTTLGHIGQAVLEAYKHAGYAEGYILDGEVYSDEISFQELIQAVKKQYPNSLKLKFRAYDIVTDDVQHLRLSLAQRVVSQIGSEHVTFVETQMVDNAELVKKLHDEYVQAGNEGAMLRLLGGTYGQGQRSRDLLKVKEFNETEFEVIKWEKGQREEDLLAVCQAPEGAISDTFTAKMQGNKAYKAELEKTNPRGKPLSVKHFGWTDGGLPRFPIGRSIRDYE